MFSTLNLQDQCTKVLLLGLYGALKVGLGILIINEHSKPISVILPLLQFTESILTDLVVLLAALTFFLPSNLVEGDPINAFVSGSVSSLSLSGSFNGSQRSTVSMMSSLGSLWRRTAITIPIKTFLMVDDHQLEGDSAAGCAAGMEMLDPWTIHTLRQLTQPSDVRQEYKCKPEYAPIFDRSDEPDSIQSSRY
ncbi:hypothetical protein TWF694_004740 [Orbilia ellipsospora]|uniref:Uncharacterized protein n=1 Tax=Orbilia ellipsospora TaxID=2528407 RepID=A0AAV9WWY9_9PEZI